MLSFSHTVEGLFLNYSKLSSVCKESSKEHPMRTVLLDLGSKNALCTVLVVILVQTGFFRTSGETVGSTDFQLFPDVSKLQGIKKV